MSGFALVLGLPHEPPIAAVIRALAAANAPHLVVDQRSLVFGSVQTWWTPDGAGGTIEVDGVQTPLDAVTGVYTRLTAWADLPEIAQAPELFTHIHDLHAAIEAWLETTSACVINRTSANDSNNSKPYQAMIIRDHFDIPATLVTNDPDAVAAFCSEFSRIIYKSVSGERSIVTVFGDADVERLPLIRNAPVQFQEYVSGVDVRVHVVGTEVFATCVESNAVDYRYDHSERVRMQAIDISPAVAAECVALTQRLGLELSGIDLRYADDGRIVCFEVNPSPAYIVYEAETGQPISVAIARRLVNGQSS
jgi:hypothetical protein